MRFPRPTIHTHTHPAGRGRPLPGDALCVCRGSAGGVRARAVAGSAPALPRCRAELGEPRRPRRGPARAAALPRGSAPSSRCRGGGTRRAAGSQSQGDASRLGGGAGPAAPAGPLSAGEARPPPSVRGAGCAVQRSPDRPLRWQPAELTVGPVAQKESPSFFRAARRYPAAPCPSSSCHARRCGHLSVGVAF